MNKSKFSLILCGFLACTNIALGQTVSGQTNESQRVITTAVPFVGFAPDARSSGMGDVGVATTADVNSVHWNNGKLAFVEHSYGGNISYSPWLANIVDDMGLYYLSGFYKLDRLQTIAISMRYFDLGEIQKTDIEGVPAGTENPREYAFDATYSRKLSENLGIGVTARYILSNLIGSVTGSSQAGSTVAIDLGTYYKKDVRLGATNAIWSSGLNFSNIGGKVTYSTDEFADFIPINLRLGTALELELDPFNTLTLALDFNKLMVPTPPRYLFNEDGTIKIDPATGEQEFEGTDPEIGLLGGMFASFSDAPDGGSEELKEITIGFGAEYWYRKLFAARAGYFYENEDKGNRQYITAGVGFRYQKFGIDFSYLIPTAQDHPLAETIRFSLLFNFDKVEDTSDLAQ